MSWKTFQNEFYYNIIYNESITEFGLTKIQIEILRFWGRFFSNYPFYETSADDPYKSYERKKAYNDYIPLYDNFSFVICFQ